MVNTNIVDCVDHWSGLLKIISKACGNRSPGYEVLLAEFRLDGSPSFAEIHEADPDISVIDIDMNSGTCSTPLFDVSSHTLRRLVEWLPKKVGLIAEPAVIAIPEDVSDKSEVVEDHAWQEPGFRPRLVAGGKRQPATAEAQLGDLTRWLELKLATMLAPSPRERAALDVPGWGITAQRARDLLGPAVAVLEPSELRDQWHEVNARLHDYCQEAALHPFDGSLGAICHAFALDRVERETLWITAAPEIAGNLARAIAFLNDDFTLRRPTLSLLSEAIEDAGPPWKLRQRLDARDPFARFRLVKLLHSDPVGPESLAPVVMPGDLTAMLRGTPPAAAAGARLFEPASHDEETDPQLALLHWASSREKAQRPVVYFHAPSAEVAWLGRQLTADGSKVVCGDFAPLAGRDHAACLEQLYAFARAARVLDAILIIAGLDALEEEVRERLVETLVRDLAPNLRLVVTQAMRMPPTALRRAAGGVTEISRPRPTREDRVAIWSEAAAVRGVLLPGEEARELAATFAFDRDQAEAALSLVAGSSALDPPHASGGALREAARIVSRASAPPSVTRIETGLGWNDLVLPVAIKTELRSIGVQVRQGQTVWDDWGFAARIPYGQAMIALLAGPSGTGKTMAAQIIAGELGAALFQVDLAKTVSKYIGETEKALDHIFEAAEAASAVLLFDEADALFGKRSEIHDAHDRYANIEVNFLLQRIEEHQAPVLLTTNRKANIDSAFLRRLSKIVDFPMPDEEQRAQIWQRMMPLDAEVADDVDLAAFRHLPLSGGGIANTVLAAAFMGAEDGGVIQMRHLVAAARGELAKSGMQSAGRSLTHLIEGARAAGGEP